MTALGILNLIAAALELCVPSYALRLIRRFGAGQAGTYVIIAFALLALIHLFNPFGSTPNGNLALSMVYGGASVLLLIGMGHTETVCRQREQARQEEKELRNKLDAEARERAEDLLTLKQEMAQEIVRLQEQLSVLSASERQYRMVFTQNPHPMWIFDLRSGRVLAGNLAALAQYGFSHQEFVGLAAKDLLARESVQAFLADVAKPCTSLESRGVWRQRRKDRSVLDVEIMAIDLRFGDCPARLIFAEDTAPRAAREALICETQRTRILQRMAEGVAHHFGQILNVVESQAGNQPGQETNPQAAQVMAETRRGAALVRQLLAVGACESIQPESVDINAFLREKELLFRRLIGERISLEFHLVEGLAPARVDLRALEHIVLNLVLNARDALPQGGAIDIHTEAVWLEAKSSGTNAQQALPGPYIHLTVGDNGCGMSAEVQEHLFEPFFTTRDNAKAMGLGLATIYGATKQHGGWVECETHPQRGTHMSVFLPVAQPDLSPEVAPETPTAPVLRETIMLVESNDRVRDLARHILQRNGYRVVEADSPATASLLLEAQAKEISLLLTDLNFPNGQSGRDLAVSLRVLNPQVKIVFASGPLSPDDTEPGILQEGKLLLKPYTPDRLLHAVRSGLSATELCPV